jgi:bacteriocin-like protein
MKSLTKNTLAMAMTLWTTAAMAGEKSNPPMSLSEKDISATVAASPTPLHALSRLDAQSVAEQEMTDQELKAVEGGDYIETFRRYNIDLSFLGTVELQVYVETRLYLR